MVRPYFMKNPTHALGIVCFTDITDHYMRVVGTRIGEARRKMSRFRLKTDYNAVINELCSEDWLTVTDSKDVNKAVAIFSNIIIDSNINKNTYQIVIKPDSVKRPEIESTEKPNETQATN